MTVFIIILIVLILIVWPTYKYGIGPTPTSYRVKAAWLNELPTIGSGPIYELGAGWGTLVFALADHYPAHRVIGIEVSPLPWLWLSLRQALWPRKNLTICYGDFFKIDLQGAALVVCYLFPKAMEKLAVKLEKECREAIVMSHTFALPHRKAAKMIIVNDLYLTPIYIYEK